MSREATEGGTRETPSKEMGPRSHGHKILNSANKNEVKSGYSPLPQVPLDENSFLLTPSLQPCDNPERRTRPRHADPQSGELINGCGLLTVICHTAKENE